MKTISILLALSANSFALDLKDLGRLNANEVLIQAEKERKDVAPQKPEKVPEVTSLELPRNSKNGDPYERAARGRGQQIFNGNGEGVNPTLNQNQFVDENSLPNWRPVNTLPPR